MVLQLQVTIRQLTLKGRKNASIPKEIKRGLNVVLTYGSLSLALNNFNLFANRLHIKSSVVRPKSNQVMALVKEL